MLVGLDGKGELMLLKNKKTGEIGWLYCDHISIPKKMTVFAEDKDLSANHWDYTSLAELNEEWEDYEEPKNPYFINWFGEVSELSGYISDKEIKRLKQIGNYFDSREEAEKAVEKLKAWKRLKDKGFRFDLSPALGHCDDKKFDISIIGTMPAKWWYNDKVVDDIHYIFGGEE